MIFGKKQNKKKVTLKFTLTNTILTDKGTIESCTCMYVYVHALYEMHDIKNDNDIVDIHSGVFCKLDGCKTACTCVDYKK